MLKDTSVCKTNCVATELTFDRERQQSEKSTSRHIVRLILGTIEGKRRRGQLDVMVGWYHPLGGHEFEQMQGDWRTGKPGVLQSVESKRVWHNWATEQQSHQASNLRSPSHHSTYLIRKPPPTRLTDKPETTLHFLGTQDCQPPSRTLLPSLHPSFLSSPLNVFLSPVLSYSSLVPPWTFLQDFCSTPTFCCSLAPCPLFDMWAKESCRCWFHFSLHSFVNLHH